MLTVIGGPVTLWIVLQTLGEDERGLWVVGVNVVALGPMIELGVGSILVQFVAHSHGASDRSYLWTLSRRWYRNAALVIALVAGTLGAILLHARRTDAFSADLSSGGWLAIVTAVALYIALVPSIAFREAGGQRVEIQRVRAVQSAVNLAILWMGLGAGLGLHALVPAAVAQWVVARLGVRLLPAPTAAFESPHAGSHQHDLVRADFQLQQRRSAMLWFLLWLAPQSLTPSLLFRGDAVDAGRLGITMALALGPTTFALAWLQARFATFGALVASGDVESFERSARKASRQALVVQAFGSIGLVALVAVLRDAVPLLHSGLLPVALLSVLLVGNTGLLMLQASLAWGRAFRTEELSIPASIGLLTTTCVVFLASQLGGLFWCMMAFAVGAIITLILALRALRGLRAQRIPSAK